MVPSSGPHIQSDVSIDVRHLLSSSIEPANRASDGTFGPELHCETNHMETETADTPQLTKPPSQFHIIGQVPHLLSFSCQLASRSWCSLLSYSFYQKPNLFRQNHRHGPQGSVLERLWFVTNPRQLSFPMLVAYFMQASLFAGSS